MPRNALQSEMRPTPRNALLGLFADALTQGLNFADKAQIPAGVPLIGGQGVGSLFVGKAPEELNEWSYGNAPMRINPNAGKTASFVPEMKPGRSGQVADLLFAAQVPGGKNALAMGMGALDSGAAQKAIFMGAKSKTWDKAAAERALALEKSGADPRAIWSETGTFKGADGMWRQEIDDSGSMFRGFGVTDSQPVGQAIHHPGAMKAYQEMADMRAQSVPGTGGSFAGEMGYAPSSPTVNLGWDNGPGTHSVALHELQHAIQKREGFAKGGSPEGMARMAREASDRFHGLGGFGAWQQGVRTPELVQAMDELSKISAAGFDPSAAHKAYQRLAGEAEARAVQSRMNLTPAQRRALFPFDSYDVPQNALIVRR